MAEERPVTDPKPAWETPVIEELMLRRVESIADVDVAFTNSSSSTGSDQE